MFAGERLGMTNLHADEDSWPELSWRWNPIHFVDSEALCDLVNSVLGQYGGSSETSENRLQSSG